jgi:tetratricopeptide (TPR) repeat protein
MLAFAIGAAFDWFWEIAAMGAIFFLAGGVLVAVRCSQLVPAPVGGEAGGGRRYGLAMAGLAVAWIAAIALVGPLLVAREIKASQSATASSTLATEAGEVGPAASYLASALNHAETARSIEPWAASPYVQLGLLAERQGDFATATARLTQAIEREDRNWQLYFLRSRAEAQAGDAAAAEADIGRVRHLNPLVPRKLLRESRQLIEEG